MTSNKFTNINELVHLKELRNLSTLEVGKNFQVQSLGKRKTTYGERIFVEFEEFNIFLGERFNQISSEDLRELNKTATEGKLFIVSKGKIGKSANIEFVNI